MRTGETVLVGLLLASTVGLADDVGLIGLPGQGCSQADGLRTLREDWGTATLRVESDGQGETVPVATTDLRRRAYACESVSQVGSCDVETLLFRAPTDPRSCDAIRATIRNRSQGGAKVRLVVAHDTAAQGLALSPGGLSAASRRLIALPEYVEPMLPMNAWGLASNAGPQPGWARPSESCDPAFRNIRVGWYGEPITYRFRVEPNGYRTVVLGLCESHWEAPKQRPLILQVEGAADARVDPVAEWGRHVPRCVAFQARDVDGDGMLTVASVTPTDAPDRNSILNVVWIFPANAPEDPEAVKRGERTAAAEYYVDCGGEKDPSLYAVGDIAYDLELPAGATRTLTFLVACQGMPAPEGLQDEAAGDRLLAQAEALWDEWYAKGCVIRVPDEEVQATLNASLAAIVMARGQASKYLVPLGRPGMDSFSYPATCDIVRALDLTGHHRDAEASLLMLWDRDLPQPIAQWGQQEDGAWRCPEGNWGTQGRVLSALAGHYALTGDRAWLTQVYPSVQKGADRLIAALAEQGGRLPQPATAAARDCDPNLWAARGLHGSAAMAAALGKPDDARRFAAAADALTAEPSTGPRGIDALRECMSGRSRQGFLPTPADAAAVPDAGQGARFVMLLRDMLVDDSGAELRLLPGVPPEWLAAEGGVSVEGLPTRFGPVSFRARLTEPNVLKLAITPPTGSGAVTIALPFSAQTESVVVAPPSRAELSGDGRELALTLGTGARTVTVRGT